MTDAIQGTSKQGHTLQWGHGAWPWMTGSNGRGEETVGLLQWGHGAWPWMTVHPHAPSK